MNHARDMLGPNDNSAGEAGALKQDSPPAEAPDYDAKRELLDRLAARLRGGLPGHLGIEFVAAHPGQMILRMSIRPVHLAANGYLHGGAVVTLADTACGFGCLANLPPGADNFTTVELKSNFLSTALEGDILAYAMLRHGGRRTQIWDAEIRTAPAAGHQPAVARATPHTQEERLLALFRCTQMILYPKPNSSADGPTPAG